MFAWRKSGKGRGSLWRILRYVLQVRWRCMCSVTVCMSSVCVRVTTGACARPAVGETSCRAWQRSRRQRALLTPLHVYVNMYLWMCVCTHVFTCVCWQDLLFISPSCHQLITPGPAGILKRVRQPTKSVWSSCQFVLNCKKQNMGILHVWCEQSSDDMFYKYLWVALKSKWEVYISSWFQTK